MPPRATRRSTRHAPAAEQSMDPSGAAAEDPNATNTTPIALQEPSEADADTVPASSSLTPSPDIPSTNSFYSTNVNPPTTDSRSGPEPTSISSTPTPRRPVQRLSSLRGRLNAASSASAPGTRPAGLKFQPKSVVRRSREEREAQERAEEERRLERIRANAAIVNYTSRGGRGGRGGFRGGLSGWKGERRGGSATGFLGGKTVDDGGSRRRGGRTGGGVAGQRSAVEVGPTAGVKRETGIAVDHDVKHDTSSMNTAGRKKTDPKVKREDKLPLRIPSDDEDEEDGPRINIEHINLISDGESGDDEPATSATAQGKQRAKSLKPPGWTLKPIRLDREQHVERSVGVNTDASLTSAQLRQKAKERAEAEGTLFLSGDDEEEAVKAKPRRIGKKGKDVEFVRHNRKWKGVYQDDDDQATDTPAIKTEPADNDEVMVLDAAEVHEDATDGDGRMEESPASTKATTGKSRKDARGDELSAPGKPKRRREPPFRPTKPVLQTQEDREEWARYEDDIHTLAEELGSLDTEPISSLKKAVDAEGDVAMAQTGEAEQEEEETKDRRQGLVYLFQMPPILPNLLSSAPAMDVNDTENGTADGNANALDAAAMPPSAAPELSSSPSAPKTAAPAKKAHPAIKIEEDASRVEKAANAVMAEDKAKFEGQVGTLRVYDSGAIGLGWGGTEFELARGGEGELLREVVVTEVGGEKRRGRTGASMGQITGGFVVMPYWEGLFAG